MLQPRVTDPRVLTGMAEQQAIRATRLAAGARHLGWKAGFGAPAALAKFALPGPLMGYLLQEGRIASGQTVSVAGWSTPVAEPEIAIYLGTDLADGADRAAVASAIAALGPAIELADLDPPPEDVVRILQGNIFHRHVILGRSDTSFAGGTTEGLTGIVNRAGQRSEVTALEANTGSLVDILAHIAGTLHAIGQSLRAGDVIIAGSVTAPLMLTAQDSDVAFRLDPVGEVSVHLDHG